MNTTPTLSRAAATSAAFAALLLLVPLFAMQITREVNWGIGDFVAAGALIFCARMAYVVVSRGIPNKLRRIVWAVVILLAFVLVWAELAVGIFS
jgi:uncharacterized membrane protein YfcA